jgi:hypothetical protein
MATGGRILPSRSGNAGADTGGRERTEAGFRAILTAAGFRPKIDSRPTSMSFTPHSSETRAIQSGSSSHALPANRHGRRLN